MNTVATSDSIAGGRAVAVARPRKMVLDDYATPPGSNLPGDYARLADDQGADWGYPPLVSVGGPVWRQSNASRYVRMFQSRRSLLMWKILGRRTDGFSNDDHPSESKPGAGDLIYQGETLDIAIHNAGVYGPLGPIDDVSWVGTLRECGELEPPWLVPPFLSRTVPNALLSHVHEVSASLV